MKLPARRVKRFIRHSVLGKSEPFPLPPTYAQYHNPDWQSIIQRTPREWGRALKRARRGKRVLVATSMGNYTPGAIFESALAVALTLRGAAVDVLLCDQMLPACQMALVTEFASEQEFVQNGPQIHCKTCFPHGNAVYRSLGFTPYYYSQLVLAEERARAEEIASTLPRPEIEHFVLDGVAVGEHAQAGALRFYARGELEQGACPEAVLRRYLQASLQTTFLMERLVRQRQYSSALFHHGIYVPQGLIGEVVRKHGVRVVNWAPGYRKRRFILTHDETYHHALMSEPTANWENIEWSDALEQDALNYLKSRWYGTRDWIWFHEKPEEEISKIAALLGIDFSKPTIGMLTNVMWDAQLHYRANAFPNMLEWVVETLRYFAQRPDLQLLIRIHPAEIRSGVPSRQPILQEIKNIFPELPGNIFIIPPESPVSTYAAMLQCDSVLIYGTKTGVELTSMGIPVIVAGEAWIRNKGITLDARSRQDYLELLERLPLGERLSDAQRTRALKYAYHFFFRRMIPLPMFEPVQGWPYYQLKIETIHDLAPGADAALDLVCDGILNGAEFVYPAERYPAALE
jgi:hypothetical protein